MPVIGPRLTPRLQREASRWRLATRPPDIPVPGPGQESVWDYPRPPSIETVEARVRVIHAGQMIADTTSAIRIAETGSPPSYYIPPADVDESAIIPAHGSTACEWKGRAEYVSVHAGKDLVERAGWRYRSPYEEYAVIRDYFAFYAQKLDECMVGDALVIPQPGGFYGGWVTPDLVGPFKGGPGSSGW